MELLAQSICKRCGGLGYIQINLCGARNRCPDCKTTGLVPRGDAGAGEGPPKGADSREVELQAA